jgi:hypothetical protein
MTLMEENQEVESVKNVLSIPSPDGDTRIMWDPRIPGEVATAKAAFDTARGEGMAAHTVGVAGEAGEVIRDFDPEQGKIVMVKPLAGG